MSKLVVVLDPGHGGYDPGATAFRLKEKDLNLMLALKVAEKLDSIKVLLTRERDTYVSLADRVALSKRAEPDLFLTLHANAGGGRGFESFIYNGLGSIDPAVAMQKALHDEIMSALNRWEVTDRGLKRAAFYVLRQNPCPAVLIESLFLDNEREARVWREPPFVEALATGVARGVRAALGLTGAENTLLVESAPVAQPFAFENMPGNDAGSILYMVQVGTFAYVENARQCLAEARKAGFTDAYIYQKQL